jgi:hypothetical protein
MKRFGPNQAIWIRKDRHTYFSINRPEPREGDLEAARYVKPGDDKGTHVVKTGTRTRVVMTSEIYTQNDLNLRKAEELFKS